jgi:hypothetical protein
MGYEGFSHGPFDFCWKVVNEPAFGTIFTRGIVPWLASGNRAFSGRRESARERRPPPKCAGLHALCAESGALLIKLSRRL